MELLRIVRGIAAFIVLSNSGALLFAQGAWNLPDFSATEVTRNEDTDLGPSKIYHAGANYRIEGSDGRVSIFLGTTGQYNLVPATQHCVQVPSKLVGKLPNLVVLLSSPNVTKTQTGTGIVEGHRSNIVDVVLSISGGKFQYKVFEALDLKNFPVKIELFSEAGHDETVFRDIVFSTPDPALFKPPSYCGSNNPLPPPAKSE